MIADPRPPEGAVNGVRQWLEESAFTEEAYLSLAETNRIVELCDGRIILRDMPTPHHQRVVLRFGRSLQEWAEGRGGGEAFCSPLPVRLWPGKFREPDVLFFLPGHEDRAGDRFARPPDLAVEVLSPDTRDTDLTAKRREYALARIREYWVADPETRTLTIFSLDGKAYRATACFGPGRTIRSRLLPGFEMGTDGLFRKSR